MDRIAQAVMEGRPIPAMVLDCHAHVGPWFNFYIPGSGIETMIDTMNRVGIDVAFVSPLPGIGPDPGLANRTIVEMIKKYPERLLGYATVNPSYTEKCLSELVWSFQHKGICGIKLHPEVQGYQVDATICEEIFRYANENGHIILSHSWRSPQTLRDLALTYPKVVFVVAHSSAHCARRGGKDYLALAREFSNIYLDLAGSSASIGTVEYMVKEAGADKMLFGSDFSFLAATVQLGQVALAEISEEEKCKILGLNLARLIQERYPGFNLRVWGDKGGGTMTG